MFAASIKAQDEKERRRQEEMAVLAEIMESEKHKRKIQAEKERLRQQAETERVQSNKAAVTVIRAKAAPSAGLPQTAGQKRKMLVNNTCRNNTQDISMSPMHKRSRTLGASSDDPRSINGAPSRTVPISELSSSSLRRSLSHRSLRQSLAQQGVDHTESDYFRLKALGVDPNTPLIPDTAATLAAKRRKENEHREAVLSKIKLRPSSTLDTSGSKQKTSPPSALKLPTVTQNTKRQSPSIVDESDDPFLRELRETRQAMTADAEWLRTQTIEIEKEIEHQEELRRSVGSNPSVENSFVESTNGFTRSISGHEYVPAILKPGQTLSRTEQRIRATGARGLATAPVGGNSRPQSPYKPVAMSRKSASRLQGLNATTEQINVWSNQKKRNLDTARHENGNAAHGTHQMVNKKLRRSFSRALPAQVMTVQDLDALRTPSRSIRLNGHNYADSDEVTEDDETGDELEYIDQARRVDGNHEYDAEEDEYSGDLDSDEDGGGVGGDEFEGEEDEDEDGEDEEDADADAYAGTIDTGLQYDGFDEEEADDDEGEDFVPSHPQYLAVSARGSRAVSASAATPDTAQGSTLDDAIELSD